MIMKILIINPVGTSKYDDGDLQYSRSKASKESEIEIVSLTKGPEEISSFESQAEICPEIFEILRRETYDAAVINCFANPCIDAAKEISEKPVVGAGEAALYLSLLLGDRISIISPVNKTVPQFLANARKMGIGDRISSIKSTGIPVEALADDPSATKKAIMDEAMSSIKDDEADVVVLGCTGMAYVADEIGTSLPVPMVEPLYAAIKVAEMLVQMELTQSKYVMYGVKK
jgi:allantoin racemase